MLVGVGQVGRVGRQGGSIPPLPYQSRIVFAGDSLTSQGFTGTVGGEQETWVARGYAPWAQIHSKHRAFAGSKCNKGVAGNTSTQLLARFTDVLSDSPKILSLLIGTNDLSTGSATTISNIASMLSQCRAIGCKVVLIKILPRYGTAYPSVMTAGQKSDWEAVNAWIATQAASDVVVVDAESTLGNMDADHTIFYDANQNLSYSTDGLHLTPLGSYKLGQLVATAINQLVESGEYRPSSAPAVPDNGFFTGTTGVANNGATGTVANNWTVSAAVAVSGGATIVASKATPASGLGSAQRIDASGTYTGSSRIIRASDGVNFNMDVGQYWQVEMDVKIDPGYTSNVTNLQAFIQAQNLQTMSNTLSVQWPEAGTFQLRSLPFKITSATTTSNVWAQATLLNTATTDAVTAGIEFSVCTIKQTTA